MGVDYAAQLIGVGLGQQVERRSGPLARYVALDHPAHKVVDKLRLDLAVDCRHLLAGGVHLVGRQHVLEQ